MSEHDSETRYYQLSLSGGQMAFGFVLALVALVGAFFLGFSAGRVTPPLPEPSAEVAEPTTMTAAPGATEPAPATVEEPLPAAEPMATSDVPPVIEEIAGDEVAATETQVPATDMPKPAAPETAPPKPAPKPKPAEPAAKPSTAAKSTEANPLPPKGPKWGVQVAALTDEADARAFRKRLVERGYPKCEVRKDKSNQKTPWKVWLGPYTTRDEAERMAARIKGAEKSVRGTIIVEW